jgi:microcin C transport system ATP-binding protein
MGLLFITHNLSIVRQLADRVAVMQNGRCVEQNGCRALFSPNTLIPAACWTASRRAIPSARPDAPVLLRAENLSIAFPIRKGLLRRVVDHNRVVNASAFICAREKRWGWSASPDRAKAPPGWRCCA